MGKQQRFSRRDCLKFGAVGAAGAAAAGIVGCTPSGGATDEAKAASPAMDGAINSSDAVLKLTDGMPKWSFMIPPEPVPDDQITETVENDIIVVGGGMSGFTTAVSAAEQGAKVTLFSAASAPISRGGSNYAKNSKVMEELGIEPADLAIRNQIGASLAMEELPRLGDVVEDMVARPEAWRNRIEEVRSRMIYHKGRGGEIAGAYLLDRMLAKQGDRAVEASGASRLDRAGVAGWIDEEVRHAG